MRLTVILSEEDEGGYSVQCLELPGCISEGETREEALVNIREAIEGYLEAFPEELERLKQRKEMVEITV
ncbi:MAG: type II toxin-antitoxin system HicB family antitoxin [Thermoproteota archaeon]